MRREERREEKRKEERREEREKRREKREESEGRYKREEPTRYIIIQRKAFK